MNIILSKESGAPFYKQIYDQIVKEIISGELIAHFPLPSIRLIAKELNVSVITVKSAYDELEGNGYIYTLVGKGSYVKELSGERGIKRELVSERLKEEVLYCKSLGIKKEDFMSIISKLFDD